MKKFSPINSDQDVKSKQQNNLLIIFIIFSLIAVLGMNLKSIVSAYRVFTYDTFIASLQDYKQKNGISALKNINNNFVAWISIEDLNISLPVVSTANEDDENYYLTHDFKHRSNSLGNPYQRHSTSINQTTNTQFIGHSVFNSKLIFSKKKSFVFGDLKKYTLANSDFNYQIKVETTTSTLNYVVFSVVEFNSKNIPTSVLNIYNTTNINSQDEFDKFYNTAKSLSAVNLQQTAQFGDKFLTLFTCSETDLANRIMVLAKQI